MKLRCPHCQSTEEFHTTIPHDYYLNGDGVVIDTSAEELTWLNNDQFKCLACGCAGPLKHFLVKDTTHDT